ncbi:hypothetical protein C3Y98_11325 [Methylotenera oryzisoli]|uniref:Uncharacterized protein n=1 Tax=Methylotenera oryzisoli TaxID=2080758 RepID=A0A4Y9VPV6_9PROT|nr:hypothetical protein [Methylotenera oryzisoli]TFW70052.1 hypothetical protein C3Y98_11325 [Methylotenera oryzisoli]
MFIEEKDIEIADIIRHYFEAVKERWPTAWDHRGEGLMLNKTNGYKGLIKLLRPVYLHLARPGEVPTKMQFLQILRKSDLEDEDFTIDNFRPGASGELTLYTTLLNQLNLKD